MGFLSQKGEPRERSDLVAHETESDEFVQELLGQLDLASFQSRNKPRHISEELQEFRNFFRSD